MSQIHWTHAIGGDFSAKADWTGGVVPGVADDAILDASGTTAYVVTASVNESVHSIQTAATATLDITVGNGAGGFYAAAGTGTGANAGTIAVANNSNFVFGGTVNNTGKITVNSGGNTTSLQVEAAGATLTGAGKVMLGDNGNNQIIGDAPTATLTNVNDTISGAGIIGAGAVNLAVLPNPGLVLVNQAAGVINATGANALIINTGPNTVVNAGLFEASAAGGLIIAGTTVNNAGGAIRANNATAVVLQNADIMGGTFQTVGSGVVETAGNTFGSLLDGTASAVSNAGVLALTNNSTLNVQGTIDNTDKIEINSGGNTTTLDVTALNATLSGGSVILSDNSNNVIAGTLTGPRGAQSVSSLTNSGVISGAGDIGLNLALTNTATIDATGANRLYLATGNANVAGSNVVANSGLIEATNPGRLTSAGGLYLDGVVINNSSKGVIEANGLTATVNLQGATISGGDLVTANGGVIETAGGDRGSMLDGTTSTVRNIGVFDITNNAALTVQGEIINSGQINLQSGGNTTALIVSAKSADIVEGTVTLSDNANNQIDGTITGPRNGQSVSKLTNQTVISGAGFIGADLLLVNYDIIDATGANALVLETGAASVAGSNAIYNDHLLENTNPGKLSGLGGLVLDGVVVNNVANAGVIEANGLHTHVDLQSATINGGALVTVSGGVIDTINDGSLLSGSAANPVNIEGSVDINNNTALSIAGSISVLAADGGDIFLNSGGNTTQLIVDAKATELLGDGAVILSDNSNNNVLGAGAGSVLTNLNNTISGSGLIGGGDLTLINQAAGVVDATGTSSQLILDTGAAVVTNTGLLEGTGGAGLLIQNTTVNGSTGGTILAGNGSVVSLQNVDIIGGTLNVAGTGAFQTVDPNSLFNGQTSAVNNEGLVNVLNNTDLTLQGALDNTGTVSLNSGGNTTQLIIDVTNATLSGAGAVILSDNTNNDILGATSAATLTNVNNTISGAGQIGDGQLTLVNQAAGVIDADVGATLTLNVGPVAVTNAGLIEATDSGTLLIQNSTVNDSTGGTILAGDGSVVSLQNAVIVGGTLNVAGTGAFQTVDPNSLFNGQTSAVNNKGLVNVLNNTDLTLQGTLDNTGAVTLNSGGNTTQLIIDVTNATLTGAGTVTLSNNGNNNIVGATSGTTLTNVNNTISGGGQIGDGQLTLVNQAKGVIDGTVSTTLVINTGANTIVNAGLIEADAGGVTVIDSAVNNTGVLEAAGDLIVSAKVTGAGKLEINGGTLELTQANVASNVAFLTANGVLQIDHAQTYAGTVTGMSTTFGTTLDLSDIGFGGSTTATYSGTTASGVLTVSDGTHIAKIKLAGNYTASTFSVSSDGHGGTDVVDPKATTHAIAASPHAFIAAMASLGATSAGSGAHAVAADHKLQPVLATPVLQSA